MPACNRHAKPGLAAGTATRMIHVVLQAAFAAKVRRPRACLVPSVPAARSTAMVFCGRWLARLRLLRTRCALFGTSGRGGARLCVPRELDRHEPCVAGGEGHCGISLTV